MHILDIIISNQSDDPIYRQIVRQIIDHIMSGTLQSGDALPSIRTLASELKISSITTKRAYDELEKEGYIYSQVGRGSFVKAQNAELLYEKRVKIVEEKLVEAKNTADSLSMDKKEVIGLLELLYDLD